MQQSAQSQVVHQKDGLNGVEKVAVLLLALGKQRASKVLKRFDAEDLKLVTRSIGDLPPLSAADLERLVEEFAHKFSSGVNFVGSAAELRDLLSGVMTPDEASPDAAAEEEPIWPKVSAVKLDALRAYLMGEHPQTVALILTKVDPDTASKVITSLPLEMRNGLMRRMLSIKHVAEPALNAIAAALRETLLAAPPSETRMGIADILNRLDKTQTEEILKSLGELRPEDAKALKKLLFTFEDLTILPQRARTVVFDQVPIERLVLSLRGTDAEFQSAILSSLASRSKRMVEAELQSGSTATPADIASARRQIVEAVLKLIAKGEIQMPTSDVFDEITV
jgi:flagellar motor switch protein FliG